MGARILGNTSEVRNFFADVYRPLEDVDLDARTHLKYRLGIWFLVASPGDVLMTRTQRCVRGVLQQEMFDLEASANLNSTAFLSRAQFSRMHGLGLDDPTWGGAMLGRACVFQAIDEDSALDEWVRGPRVRLLEPVRYPARYNSPATLRKTVLEETDVELLGYMAGPDAFAVNLGDAFDVGLASLNMTSRDWWCRSCTLHQVLLGIGVNDAELCMHP